jgi:hypothetical protein
MPTTDEFIPFPSIGQFRNTIKAVQSNVQYKGQDADDNPIVDRAALAPTLTYKGYIKLHGTNAAVVSNPSGTFYAQSRKRVLSLESDNFGFADYVINRVDDWDLLFGSIAVAVDEDLSTSRMVVYGEWCGPGVQNGVGLDKLTEKMFVIFAIRLVPLEGEPRWVHLDDVGQDLILPHARTRLITEFPTYEIEVDFDKPSLSQNILGAITNSVEECCPVAKQVGDVEGIGEGVVWTCLNAGFESSDYWFKVKGEKHSESKVKTLAAIDPEFVQSVNEFIDNTVTENRLEHGLQMLRESNTPIDIKATGTFLKWVYQDIIKEESDVLEASQLDLKAIGGPVSRKARAWWMRRIEES